LPRLPAQAFLALEDAALDRAQRLELLAQRFLALVALLVRALVLGLGLLPLAPYPVELAGQPLALHDLGGEQRRKAAGPGRRSVGERLEQLRRPGVIAQRRRQRGEHRGEP